MFQIVFSSQILAQERETISPSKSVIKTNFQNLWIGSPLVMNNWVETPAGQQDML